MTTTSPSAAAPMVLPPSEYQEADNATLSSWIGDLFEAFWAVLRNGLEDLADFWMSVLYGVLTFGMDAFGGLLLMALSILPAVPPAPTGGAFQLIASANTFVPIEESFVALSFIGAVWAARGVYLLARFIRGGG